MQRVEHVVPELAADGQEELAGKSCIEVAPAESRELDILGQELCRVHLDVEPACAARFLEQRADAAPACALSQRHWEAGARQFLLELRERGRGFSCWKQCNELRHGTGSDSVHEFLDGRGRSPAIISSVPAGSDMHIGRSTGSSRCYASGWRGSKAADPSPAAFALSLVRMGSSPAKARRCDAWRPPGSAARRWSSPAPPLRS